MKICDYDRVSLLCIDKRYLEHTPRINLLIESKGNVVKPFINGDGRTLPASLYNRINKESPPSSWKSGIGAYYFHLGVRGILQAALDDGVENLLFIEDDLFFTEDFDEVVEKATKQLADLPDWDMLYYGANHSGHRTTILSDNVLKLHGSYTTHCMGIRRRMFEPLLALPPVAVTDLMISQAIHHQYNCYGLWPNVAQQLPGQSFITPGHQDYLNLFKSKGANHCLES